MTNAVLMAQQYKQGMSLREIAAAHGNITMQGVHYWLKKQGVEMRPKSLGMRFTKQERVSSWPRP